MNTVMNSLTWVTSLHSHRAHAYARTGITLQGQRPLDAAIGLKGHFDGIADARKVLRSSS